jgi:PQQ-like domain
MTWMNRETLSGALAVIFMATGVLWAADWPMWGGGPARNGVSAETNLPTAFDAGAKHPQTGQLDPSAFKNIKWIAPLGSQTYGNPMVAGGRVFVGTNNDPGRDPARAGDYGVVLCLDEQTGRLLWQLTAPKLRAGGVSDFEQVGICSAASVDGDRAYVVTNRCEVICLDVKGLSDGNDGPFRDEAKYVAGPGEPPIEVRPGDADIIWVFDMRDELGVGRWRAAVRYHVQRPRLDRPAYPVTQLARARVPRQAERQAAGRGAIGDQLADVQMPLVIAGLWRGERARDGDLRRRRRLLLCVRAGTCRGG